MSTTCRKHGIEHSDGTLCPWCYDEINRPTPTVPASQAGPSGAMGRMECREEAGGFLIEVDDKPIFTCSRGSRALDMSPDITLPLAKSALFALGAKLLRVDERATPVAGSPAGSIAEESPGPMSSGQRPDVPSIAIRAPDSNQGAGSPAGLDLGAIERRAKAACPGPWVKTSHQDGRVTYWTVNRGMEDENGNVTLLPGRQLFRVMRSGDEGANDAGFLAHAREDIFALLEIARAALAAPVALGAAPNGVREAAALRVCSLLDGFQKEYEYNTLGRKMPGNDLYGDKLMAIVEEARAALSSPLSVGAALPPELIGDGPCDDCGTANNIRWFIESETWNKVVREGNPMDAMLCINCFVKRAALRGIDPPAWELVVEDEFNPGPRRNAPDERSESEPSNSHVTGSEVEGKKGDEAQGPVIDMDGGLIDQSEDYPCPFCTQPLESHNGYYTCPNKACSFPLGYSKAPIESESPSAGEPSTPNQEAQP